jgi:hypothetical protein
MRGLAAAALLTAASCSSPSAPPDYTPQYDLIERLQQTVDDKGHGPYHPANNSLQRELWSRLQGLPSGPGLDRLLLEAVENVYTRYDMNYFHGILWHWPYLCSRRAIELCDRALRETKDPQIRERALWLKAFALRCPPTEPWDEAEKDLETYAEQRRWSPNFNAAREMYRTIASEFPTGSHAAAAARLAAQADLSVVLPKGPRERDPREPR